MRVKMKMIEEYLSVIECEKNKKIISVLLFVCECGLKFHG